MHGGDALFAMFRAVTPVDELADARFGSRPAYRPGAKSGIAGIRAIPWGFGWTQIRLMLTGWLGDRAAQSLRGPAVTDPGGAPRAEARGRRGAGGGQCARDDAQRYRTGIAQYRLSLAPPDMGRLSETRGPE